jgi:hypothetical protein
VALYVKKPEEGDVHYNTQLEIQKSIQKRIDLPPPEGNIVVTNTEWGDILHEIRAGSPTTGPII